MYNTKCIGLHFSNHWKYLVTVFLKAHASTDFQENVEHSLHLTTRLKTFWHVPNKEHYVWNTEWCVFVYVHATENLTLTGKYKPPGDSRENMLLLWHWLHTTLMKTIAEGVQQQSIIYLCILIQWRYVSAHKLKTNQF